MKQIKPIYKNGGHWEEPAFSYMLRNIFQECNIQGRFTNQTHDFKIYIMASFPNDYKSCKYISDNSGGKGKSGRIFEVTLDDTIKDDLVILFTGESWDIDAVKTHESQKYVVFSPYRNDPLNNIIQMPWIVISYIQFHRVKYIYKYQNNKDKLNKKYFIAYCATNHKVENRGKFMNMIVSKYNNHKLQSEIYSLGGHFISNTIREHLPKYRSPSTLLVDKYSEFKFAVVFENTKKKGYITEKLLQAFIANTIPIYYGDHELAKQLFNPKAMICVDDFENYDECIDFIYNMSDSDIKDMLAEPMFKDNITPEMFDVTNFETGYFGYISKFIRNLYD